MPFARTSQDRCLSPRALRPAAMGLLPSRPGHRTPRRGAGPDMRCWEPSWASRPTSFGLRFLLQKADSDDQENWALQRLLARVVAGHCPRSTCQLQGLHRKGAALGWPTCLEGKAGSQSGPKRPCPIFPCLGQAPPWGSETRIHLEEGQRRQVQSRPLSQVPSEDQGRALISQKKRKGREAPSPHRRGQALSFWQAEGQMATLICDVSDDLWTQQIASES